MSAVDIIKNYPEVSFIENMTLDQMMGEMISDFQTKYEELTGEPMELSRADPNRLLLHAAALQIYQGFAYIDNGAKQSLLKYTRGDNLDQLCALKGIVRNSGSAAYTTIRFSLSDVRNEVITIPRGVRVTDLNGNYFYTKEGANIAIGELTTDVTAICAEVGVESNDIEVGELRELVDSIPYVMSAVNITKTQGGSDIEDDESLKERFFFAQSSFSVAGPDDAYVYWVKTYSSSIQDVRVTSPSPCVVDIRFILEDGKLPEETMVNELKEYLEERKIRPLTDLVQISAPDSKDYSIDMDYYINQADKVKETLVKEAVNQAVKNYLIWQSGAIGRDINPNMLIQFVMEAGAKRVEVREPVYAVTSTTSVPKIGTQTVNYGGLEND